MAALQSEADRVLQTMQEKRSASACYPCAKRKVRCSGGQPCITCSQRNHPDICFYPAGKRSNKRKYGTTRAGSPPSAVPVEAIAPTQQAYSLPSSSIATPSLSHAEAPQSVPRRSHTTTLGPGPGPHSVASFLEARLQNARPGLGLQNHSAHQRNPGSTPNATSYASSNLIAIAPQRSEIFRFFPSFRINVMPFILKDGDELELAIFTFPSDFESARAKGDLMLHTYAETQRNRMSVCLACLALGAQMSEISAAERARYADDFVRRSIAALQFPEMMLFPCFQSIQALLMVGMSFQNSGSSDASWSLLGLTFRLAQSLGLHNPDHDKHDLWKSVIWQDALLSLRFGRTPLQTAYHANRPELLLPSDQIDTYVDAMHTLNAIGLAYMSISESDRAKMDGVRSWIAALESLRQHLPPHLRGIEDCLNLQQTLQFYAFRMHISFLEAEMCRPCLMHTKIDQVETPAAELSERAFESMRATVSAYLSMARLSVLPLRNWSLIQESLSCACVLALLKACRGDSEVQSLLDEIIRLLECELTIAGYETQQGNWTCSTALKLLRASRAYREQPDTMSGPVQSGPTAVNAGDLSRTQEQSLGACTVPVQFSLPTPESQPSLLWSGSPFDSLDVPFASFFEWSSELFEQNAAGNIEQY
ncbi:hypothetical protein AC579_4551 [Pseudocercospora musae]|uniref:Zn(2)-C6 fungal-type domain-containing protein n=1 Tax=Pseudocercospora musae TaxID=113226 RepID=A0A139IU23_9PEZI|nr:hypothetical protein AC579_4551 [Pseudocercospora musae]KXT18082.1 hypothetical protein AC579_4551 [Pseudocercospora musae]KXT18083.1 hypothetical protein AC579_4551 [Pseudocercospora musae]KXT18084.1 hypothetical protein AC579_4551 [Pseudocercospora musae]